MNTKQRIKEVETSIKKLERTKDPVLKLKIEAAKVELIKLNQKIDAVYYKEEIAEMISFLRNAKWWQCSSKKKTAFRLKIYVHRFNTLSDTAKLFAHQNER